MKLIAISDLHLSHRLNREALPGVTAQPDAWLAVAGDIGHQPDHLVMALEALVPKFAQVIWTPGNHDLWHRPGAVDSTRGDDRYQELVEICRRHGVLTPEDPYPELPGHPGLFVVPMFLLFDYSFRPDDVDAARALAWARETRVVSTDERRLDPHPFSSREAWCEARCQETEARLQALPPHARTVLINHWPLRYDLARPPRIPRFSLWCGTKRTEEWPTRFRAERVISGHLHLRTTLYRHGVRYDEVSLGYPRDWRVERGIDWYLRRVVPTTREDERFAPPRDPFR
jgi:3',5'-cyclic AMP phosphodiesterase CpdA